MADSATYRTQIKAYKSHVDLLKLWQRIGDRTTAPDWESGKALEYLFVRAFEIEGATVRYPYTVKLASGVSEQIDGVIYVETLGLSCLVESKDWKRAANVEPIAELRSQLARRPTPTFGVFVSTNGFTDPALALLQFMQPQTILTWEGREIEHGLQQHIMTDGLVAKYRHCVEYGYPLFNITTL